MSVTSNSSISQTYNSKINKIWFYSGSILRKLILSLSTKNELNIKSPEYTFHFPFASIKGFQLTSLLITHFHVFSTIYSCGLVEGVNCITNSKLFWNASLFLWKRANNLRTLHSNIRNKHSLSSLSKQHVFVASTAKRVGYIALSRPCVQHSHDSVASINDSDSYKVQITIVEVSQKLQSK